MGVFQTGTLQLPNELAKEIIKKTSETSTVARLAPETAAQTLLNSQYTLVTTSPEAEIVGEGVAKTQGELATEPKITATHKAVVTLRFSDEVVKADNDTQIGLLREAGGLMSDALSRALDYTIYHGISPKGAQTISGVTPLVTVANQQTATASALADIDALPDLVIEAGYEFSGIALSTAYANALRKVRNADGVKMFPEIPLNVRDAGDLGGVKAAVSNTVNGSLITPATGISAIGGDFNLIKWGIVQEVPVKLIEFGDPDNTGRDLQGYNEVALRCELMFKYVVIDPKGFTVLKVAEG